MHARIVNVVREPVAAAAVKAARKRLRKIPLDLQRNTITRADARDEIRQIRILFDGFEARVALVQSTDWWTLLPGVPGTRARDIAREHAHPGHSADHLATDIPAAFAAAGHPLPPGMGRREQAAERIYQYVTDNTASTATHSGYEWRSRTFTYPDITSVTGMTTCTLARPLVICVPGAVAHPSNPNGTAFIA